MHAVMGNGKNIWNLCSFTFLSVIHSQRVYVLHFLAKSALLDFCQVYRSSLFASRNFVIIFIVTIDSNISLTECNSGTIKKPCV